MRQEIGALKYTNHKAEIGAKSNTSAIISKDHTEGTKNYIVIKKKSNTLYIF